MKKAPSTKKTVKMTSTNQIILAAIMVLLIFLAALLSSPPKKDQVQQTASQPVQTNGELRTGTQVARISITRNDGTPTGATIGTTGFTQPSAATVGTTGTLNVEPGAASKNVGVSTTNGTAATQTVSAEITSGAVPAGDRVKFKIDNFKKLAVQPLKFKVFDSSGRELTPDFLLTVREHKLHFVVVSANLREFQHLYPEYVSGQWNVNANLPSPGTYYVFTDITPVKGTQEILRSELTVREATKGTINYPGLTPNLLAISNGTSAVLGIKGIGLGAENVLGYSLTRDGKNLGSVTPYTGAFGYVTVLRQGDPGVYLTARPLPVQDESKGIFDFAVKFMKAGKYTAFAEFKADGKVLIFPITFEMP
jgi:hypothetical protein